MDAVISSSQQWRFSPPRTKLAKLYQKLSKFYELLELSRHQLSLSAELAVVTILEEDLLSLLEECEEYIIGGEGLRRSQFEAFESRSFTVLEEIQALGFRLSGPRDWAIFQTEHLSCT